MSLCYEYMDKGMCSKRCPAYNKDYMCMNAAQQRDRDIKVGVAMVYLDSCGIEHSPHYQGLLISNRFIFSPKTNKWRAVKKNKWYRSMGIADFHEKYFEDKVNS